MGSVILQLMAHIGSACKMELITRHSLCISANPSIGKGEAGGFAVTLKPAWATQ